MTKIDDAPKLGELRMCRWNGSKWVYAPDAKQNILAALPKLPHADLSTAEREVFFELMREKRRGNFWASVQINGVDSCWIWTGSKKTGGYGQYRIASKTRGKYVPIIASRAAYILGNGTIPEGMLVCHSCDNPSCCNPRHLWLGTSADNTKDKMSKGRHRWPARSPTAKLTEEQVLAIRGDKRRAGIVAAKYGISTRSVWKVRTGKTWGGLPQ